MSGDPIAAGKPEWWHQVLTTLHDLEEAGRKPGTARTGNVMAHLSFPGDPYGAVFLGVFPLVESGVKDGQ